MEVHWVLSKKDRLIWAETAKYLNLHPIRHWTGSENGEQIWKITSCNNWFNSHQFRTFIETQPNVELDKRKIDMLSFICFENCE